MRLQADLFIEPHWSDVPAPWPHATPAQVRLVHEARKLPPLPTAADYWARGQFQNITLGLAPSPLRNTHGVPCEEWRRVVSVLDHDGEEVPISLGWWASDLGRVYFDGWKTGKPCWPHIIRDARTGYRSAVVGSTKIKLHRLVASAFATWPEPRRITGEHVEVRHLDGDPANNRATNLAYGTPRENALDRHRHGTMRAKLTAEDVTAIRSDHGLTDAIIADALGVDESTVQDARTGRTWRHLELARRYIPRHQLPPTKIPKPGAGRGRRR